VPWALSGRRVAFLSRGGLVVPSRSRTWAVLGLAAALFGGVERVHAQPLNEPPPRPLALAGLPTAIPAGRNVIATTKGRPAPLPFTVKVTVPDDGLTTPAKPIQVVDYRPGTDSAPALAKWPAVVFVEVAEPTSVALGEPLHYELVVRNTGGAAAGRVQVEDPLPSGARLLAADPAAEQRAGSLIWELGTLEAGAERRLKVDLQHVGIVGTQQAPRVAYTAAAGLRTQVTRPAFMVALLGPPTAAPGAAISFQIQLSNDGTVPIRHIVLHDQLPPGLTSPGGYSIEAEVGDLAPGQSRTIRLDIVASQVGRFVNEIVAVADDGIRGTSRCALEVGAAPEDKTSDDSSFAAGR
jgi:uncharacterized repeat protein (TIGR01451 family)